ncbi:hypothetical protein PHJA_001815600 [Phtheirospermum japonicum]|uniref:DUF1771 domain-containing protein n=1 Tax=Phtheirospermum japonicum TaxID=374723 RepID=A0A830CNT3_9LAMI|nr:hypothetical protein PHJA_001815600 [Phtheirospermum japonicum]
MKVELAPSSSSYTDEDQKNLKQLLEAFGSVISLEDMASAYCEAGRDLELTAEKLCTMQTSDAGSSFPNPLDNVENPTGSSSGCTSNNIPENDNLTKSKPKKCSASMGTVSGVIGKDYMKPTTQPDGLHQKSKPMIINSDDFPVSEIWDERKESASTSRSESMDSDIQEFLCKMLGVGFQLEKSVIQDVVGQCGYNMPMSIDKLIDLSAATLEKSDDVVGVSAGKAAKNSLDLESVSCRTKSPAVSFSGRSNSDGNRADGVMLPETGTKKKDVQREVLEALFSGPDRFEGREPIVPIRQSHRSVHGQVVTKPPNEMLIEDFVYIKRQPTNERSDESKEASYEELRRAVAEYWVIMKEYLKASLDAYTRKDYETAEKLQEEANFYNRKAREADELSAQKLIEGSDEQEDFSINMHYLEPRDALHHMKLHLTSFSGLTSIPYLKAVVGTDGVDKKDARRKRLITKLLEKDGIPWTEEGNGWIISVRVDEIDPSKLSFANK